MAKIWPRYAQEMAKIYSRYGQDMLKIWPRYAQHMARYMLNIWPRYGECMPKMLVTELRPQKVGQMSPGRKWDKMSPRRKTKYPWDKMSPNHLEQAGRVFPQNFLRTANARPWSHDPPTPFCFNICFETTQT